MTEQYVHFVRHQDVADFYELGWTISSFLDGDSHGAYSIIMEWPNGDPVRTPNAQENLSGRGDANRELLVEGDDILARQNGAG